MLLQGMQRGRYRRNGALQVSNVRNKHGIKNRIFPTKVLFLYRLYEKLGEDEQAAGAYTDFVMDEFRNVDKSDLIHAYKYLIHYHIKREHLDQANHFAQKCLQFDETKEEAWGLLRTITEKRAIRLGETFMMVNKNIFFSQYTAN